MIHGIITPRLAEAGKVKIGHLGKEITSKSGTKFRPPVKDKSFTITKTTRDANGDLEIDKALMAALKKDKDGELTEIPIQLHSDVVEEVFPHNLAMYAGKKIGCRGDGKTARRFVDIKNNTRFETPQPVMCPCPLLGAESGKFICKPHGNLHFSIAAGGLAVAGAVHMFRTTSVNSIQMILASLQQIISVAGTLKGIPLVLKVSPKRVEPPNAPASTVYVVHVELRASDIIKVQQHALEMAENRRALGGNFALDYNKVVQPPADERETPEEQAEVAQEFHGEAETNTDPAPPVHEEPRRKQVQEPAPKVHEPEVMAGTYRGQITTVTFNADEIAAGKEKGKAVKKRYALHTKDPKDPENRIFYTFSETAALLGKEVKTDGGTGEELVIHWKRTNWGLDASKVTRAAEFDQAEKDKEAEKVEDPDKAE